MSTKIVDKVVGYFKNKKEQKEKILLEEEFNTIYNNIVILSHNQVFKDILVILDSCNNNLKDNVLKDKLEQILYGIDYKVLLNKNNLNIVNLLLNNKKFLEQDNNLQMLNTILKIECFKKDIYNKQQVITFLNNFFTYFKINVNTQVSLKNELVKHNYNNNMLKSILINVK